MKVKILSSLKTKYANLGFGDKAFDGVAEYLSKSVTEEAQIETAISGVEVLLKSFQGDIDKVRGEKTTLQKQYDELKEKAEKGEGQHGKGGGKEKDKTDEEPPAWFKIHLEQQDAKFKALEQIGINKSRRTVYEEKIKELPDEMKASKLRDFDRISGTFKDDNDFNGYLTEVETDVTKITQSLADAGLSKFKKPGSGGESKTEEDQFIKQMQEINSVKEEKK